MDDMTAIDALTIIIAVRDKFRRGLITEQQYEQSKNDTLADLVLINQWKTDWKELVVAFPQYAHLYA